MSASRSRVGEKLAEGKRGADESGALSLDGLRAYPLVHGAYVHANDLLGNVTNELKKEHEDQAAAERIQAKELIPALVPLVTALRAEEIAAGVAADRVSDVAELYETSVIAIAESLNFRGPPVRALIEQLGEVQHSVGLRGALVLTVRDICTSLTRVTGADGDPLPISAERHKFADCEALSGKLGEAGEDLAALQSEGVATRFGESYVAFLQQLSRYINDRDEDASNYLIRSNLRLFCFCVALTCLRRRRDAEAGSGGLTAGAYARQFASNREFLGEPIAYQFYATALHDEASGHHDAFRLLGMECARAAYERFSQSPGVAHNLSLYEMSAASASGLDEEDRVARLEHAQFLADKAIALDPFYPRYYETRAKVRLEKSDYVGADSDVIVGKSLDVTRRSESADWEDISRQIRDRSAAERREGRFSVAREEMVAAKGEMESVTRETTERHQHSQARVEHLDDRLDELQEDVAASRRETVQVVAFVAGAIGIITAAASIGTSAASGSGVTIWTAIGLLLAIVVSVLLFLAAATLLIRRETSSSPPGSEKPPRGQVPD